MHYKQLDGLRFFAVISVIFHHISPLHKLVDLGEFGVNLFFVISGFLITEILIRQKLSGKSLKNILKTFFIRRVLRIFPLYYLYILICFFVVPIQTSDFLIWMLTYCVNIWIAINNELAFWYFTHLWSLSLEEQFYLFWPFLLLLIPIKQIRNVTLLLICSAILLRFLTTCFFDNYHLFNYVMLPSAFDCFGLGALLAYLKIFEHKRMESILNYSYLVVLIFGLYVLNNYFGLKPAQEVLNRFLQALIAFFLVGVAVTTQFKFIFKKILENKIIRYVGKISYGMYIYHLLIWGSFGPYFNEHILSIDFLSTLNHYLPQRFLEFLFVSGCTIIVSAVSYELVEKQFLKLKKYTVYN